MKKYLLLFGMLAACSSTPHAKTTQSEEPPKRNKVVLAPENIVLDEPLSQVQTMCLTEGTTSLNFARQWVHKHMTDSCDDNPTSMKLYNNASGAGERDAIRVVSANMLECFASVNDLPEEGADVMAKVAKQIMDSAEIKTLGETLDAKSCLSVEAQHAFIKGGMSCGFLLSLASNSTMLKALDVYKEAGVASEMVDPNNKEAMGSLLMQGSMCYKMVLDGIRKNMGLTPDDEPEETPPTRHTTDI